MAGFKRTIMDFDPIWFITFDGDHVIGSTGIIDGNTVIDEVGNTEGIIHDEHGILKGYYGGLASHVQAEQSHQASIRFGVNTRHPMSIASNISLAPCSYIEVPNKKDSWWDKDEFTLIFTMKKDAAPYEDWIWEGEVGNSNQVYSMDESVMRLGNIFEFRGSHRSGGCSYSYVDMFIDETGTPLYTETSDCYGRTPFRYGFSVQQVNSSRASFCVIRYKNGIFEYIVDGHTIFKRDLTKVNGYDATIHSIPRYVEMIRTGLKYDEMTFFLGGRPTNEIRVTRPKKQSVTRTEFDQMSLFNRYIDNDDIMRLYRRMWFRDVMYNIESPTLYIPMNEEPHEITSDTSVKVATGSSYGSMYINDSYVNISTRQEGRYIDEYGIFYPEKGITLPYTGGSVINLNSDFTFEFSIKGYSSNRSCVFQTIERDGINEFSLFANSNDGELRIGWCDLRHFDGHIISFNCDLLDDEWHRVIVRKRSNSLDLYVDGAVYLKNEYCGYVKNHDSVTTMLTGYERNVSFGATLSEVLIYHKALDDIILKSHVNYEYLYKINGEIVSGGQPFKAKIRVYSHESGRLLAETYSSPDDGTYTVYLPSNEMVDLMVHDGINETVKIRAVGLIDPDVVNDTVLTLP